MHQATLSDAVMVEISRRINAIEERIKQLPWYAFQKKAREARALRDHLRHQHIARFDDLIAMPPPVTFNPNNPEDIILRDLLASPSAFDS